METLTYLSGTVKGEIRTLQSLLSRLQQIYLHFTETFYESISEVPSKSEKNDLYREGGRLGFSIQESMIYTYLPLPS